MILALYSRIEALLQLVYRKLEEEGGEGADEAELERQAEEERLLEPGSDDYPTQLQSSFHGLFDSNIISLACRQSQQVIFVGTGTRPDHSWHCTCMMAR